MPEKTRVNRFIQWCKNNRFVSFVFGVIVILVPVISTLGDVTESVTKVGDVAKHLFVGNPLRGIPDRVDFEQWAAEFSRAHTSNVEPNSMPQQPAFDRANEIALPVYQAVADALRDACLTYRRRGYPNLYVDLPRLPVSIFTGEAAIYRAGVTFSRYCSWSVRVNPPKLTSGRTGPIFQLVLMDGDGHVKGGSGIGTVKLWYGFDDEQVQVRTTGIASPILREIPRTMPASEFKKVANYTAKLLVEHQLTNCQATRD
jgi:hypothetical protein